MKPEITATVLAPRRHWCKDCGGDGCIMCEGTGDGPEWRGMTMQQRAAARDDELRAMLAYSQEVRL